MQRQRHQWLSLGWSMIPCLVLGLARPGSAEVVTFNLLHLNDLYEITPVQGGKRGGLARVATLRQQLLHQNPRTYTILAGDLLSPSALGTAKVEGVPLAGQQMVAVMNAVGLDYATFGNHEFDLSEAQFRQRLQESRFQWVSSNVSDRQGNPFAQVPRHVILPVQGDQGAVVRVGLIGLTLNSNPKEYVSYQSDVIAAARQQVAALKGQVDLIVAITHLSLEQDQQLAAAVPELDLILGGHEHENIQQWRWVVRSPQSTRCSRDTTPIFKADANATTIYVHHLSYDTTTDCLTIESELREITADIPDDPQTAAVVQQWQARAFAGFRAEGFEPQQVVATIDEPLDGLESSVRQRPTALTQLIARSMLRAMPQAELSLFNSGAIRVDDVLPPGDVTQYDVIRILPFGGKVLLVNLRGDVLKRVLEIGQQNQGSGGYVQSANVSPPAEHGGSWLVQGHPLEPNRLYRVAINNFLVSGREVNLGFLKLGEPGVELVSEGEDVRFALIQELQAQ